MNTNLKPSVFSSVIELSYPAIVFRLKLPDIFVGTCRRGVQGDLSNENFVLLSVIIFIILLLFWKGSENTFYRYRICSFALWRSVLKLKFNESPICLALIYATLIVYLPFKLSVPWKYNLSTIVSYEQRKNRHLWQTSKREVAVL